MVTFSPVLYPPEQAHRRVPAQILVELHGVQILHGDPSEYRPRLFYIRAASAHQLPHQVRERFLVFLGYLIYRKQRKGDNGPALKNQAH